MAEIDSTRITILIPNEMCEEVDQLAKENQVSRSYIIRTAIQEQLDSFESTENV